MKQADREIINLLEQIAGGGGGAESDPLALKIANNLSDLNNVGTARTNLDLVPGTDVQEYSVNLDTWAGIVPAAGVSTFLTTGDLTAAMTWDGETKAQVVDGAVAAAEAALLPISLTADVTGTLPVANGGTGITSLGAGVATFWGTPSSANLRGALTDENGTGVALFDGATSATLTTPVINGLATGTGVATAGTANTLALRDASGDLTARDLIVGVGRNLILRSGGIQINSPSAGYISVSGGFGFNVQALSGAGAVNLTTVATAFTSTGAGQALTLADGVAGQIKTIAHVVDGGSGVLTPTTKTGFTTITFTNAGDAVTLQFFATAGWCVIGLFGAVAA